MNVSELFAASTGCWLSSISCGRSNRLLLRKFNQKGLDRFNEYLSDLNVDNRAPVPPKLLESNAYSAPDDEGRQLDKRRFPTRFELAQYLVEEVGVDTIGNLEMDTMLWSWLALFYFDQLCPASSTGERIPRERARIVFNTDAKMLFRHLIAGPVFVYLAHRDTPQRVRPMLSDPVSQTGRLYLEITDRRSLLQSPGVVEAAGKLYFDFEKGTVRPGSRSKTPGKIIRFATVLFQFDATWDLQSLTCDQIIDLLPGEFDEYKRLSNYKQAVLAHG